MNILIGLMFPICIALAVTLIVTSVIHLVNAKYEPIVSLPYTLMASVAWCFAVVYIVISI